MHLSIRVAEVKGSCPVYEEGDAFVLEDRFKLVSDKPVCMHGLAALMPHYNALRVSEPGMWGLAGKDDPSKAYVQCLDPLDYTGGGTAVFEITRVDDP